MSSAGRFDVVWSEMAYLDLAQLSAYLVAENPHYAKDLLQKIKGRAATLAFFPRRGRLIPELRALGLEMYRELIVDPYRIFFRIAGKKVFVFGIVDGRRDLQEIIFERLIHPIQ